MFVFTSPNILSWANRATDCSEREIAKDSAELMKFSGLFSIIPSSMKTFLGYFVSTTSGSGEDM